MTQGFVASSGRRFQFDAKVLRNRLSRSAAFLNIIADIAGVFL